jgi:DNA-binding NarL/FixJ family response regulator
MDDFSCGARNASRNLASSRILVVDDHERWRQFFSTTLQKQPELQVIGEASDGLEATGKAKELNPDLILFDIGLPTLNGIEAARRIREVSPACKILFVSENRSLDIVERAFGIGAGGYVVKADAGSELLPAVEAVLQGNRYISASLAGHDLAEAVEGQRGDLERKQAAFPVQKRVRHEVEFYADDAGFLDGFARFIGAALKRGDGVIVVATEAHQASLLRQLTTDGLNMLAEIEQGNYIPLEVTKTLASFMLNNSPDPILFRRAAGELIRKAARQANGHPRRVAACGEGVSRLLAAGNLDATIALERLWNEAAELYEIDILCGYFRSDFASSEDISALERVCAEHSAGDGAG